MGDQNTPITEADLRHLLARTGFGPAAKDVKKARKLIGQTRGAAADHLIALKRKGVKLKDKSLSELHDSWVKQLTKAKNSFHDKATLFWHDHFSVNADVVDEDELTKLHIETHYAYALGNFKDYCKAINKDPAMMIFLNTVQNEKAIPNENYPRELCELFTLGVFDLNGVENYGQDDIVQIARAFTGWDLTGENDDEAFLRDNQHDYTSEFPERGPKVLFDNAHGFPAGGASFTTGGEGENEIDEVIDIIFDHLDSDGMNTVARRTAFRLLEFYAYANPDKTTVDEVVAESGFAGSWNIEQLIRAILVHDAFYETTASLPFSAGTKKSVKWPIDFVVGTMRMLKMKPKGKALVLRGGDEQTLRFHLTNMGQRLTEPPSVFGWDWEDGWVSSATLLARYAFVRDIIDAREASRFKPEKLIDDDLTDAGDIADAVLAALAMTDQFTVVQRQGLIDYLSDSGVNPTLDLSDDDIRNTKLHGAFSLVLQSPAFQLH